MYADAAWTRKHPFNTWTQSQIDVAYSYEYASFHYQEIFAALQAVDKARDNLVKTQNKLASLIRKIDNPYTKRMFHAFYWRGGVTAQDWKAFFEQTKDRWVEEDDPAVQVPRRNIPEGRTHDLRVVPSQLKGKPVCRGRPNSDGKGNSNSN